MRIVTWYVSDALKIFVTDCPFCINSVLFDDSKFWSDFFPMWYCTRARGCAFDLEEFDSGDADGDGTTNDVGKKKKKKKDNHQEWEENLCACLTASSYPVFHHAKDCEITFQSAPIYLSGK